MRIITNNHPRDIIYAGELTEEEQKEFDYIDWDNPESIDATFVRYKGELIDLSDMEHPESNNVFPEWDTFRSDTFFSGILVKWTEDFEQVIMGRYYT